jgi:hypothetical protein
MLRELEEGQTPCIIRFELGDFDAAGPQVDA